MRVVVFRDRGWHTVFSLPSERTYLLLTTTLSYLREAGGVYGIEEGIGDISGPLLTHRDPLSYLHLPPGVSTLSLLFIYLSSLAALMWRCARDRGRASVVQSVSYGPP